MYLCLHDVTNFEYVVAPNDRKRKLCEFAETWMEKLVKSLWVNLFSAGFSLLGLLCAAAGHCPIVPSSILQPGKTLQHIGTNYSHRVGRLDFGGFSEPSYRRLGFHHPLRSFVSVASAEVKSEPFWAKGRYDFAALYSFHKALSQLYYAILESRLCRVCGVCC